MVVRDAARATWSLTAVTAALGIDVSALRAALPLLGA
jgi:hypothetical protein